MWAARTEQLLKGRALKVAVIRDSAPVSYADVLRLWQQDEPFRSFFIALLVDAPFKAFRWETPPVTAASVDRPFEFILLDSPGLANTPDPQAFSAHFRGAAANESVVSFPNLGRDAILVVPCPAGPQSAYGHLAAFVRGASGPQVHSLWQRVGSLAEETLGPAPVWLSTAGAGVPWLHIRLDRRPKYYGYGPYRDLA